MAGFVVSGFRVSVNGAALNSMEANPGGPVGTIMRQKANVALNYARAHCPVESEASASAHHRASGRLVASLKATREISRGGAGAGVEYLVGSTLIYSRRIEFNPRVGGFLRAAAHLVASR